MKKETKYLSLCSPAHSRKEEVPVLQGEGEGPWNFLAQILRSQPLGTTWFSQWRLTEASHLNRSYGSLALEKYLTSHPMKSPGAIAKSRVEQRESA